MKTSLMLIVFSVFLFSAASLSAAEQDDYQKGLTYYHKHNYKTSLSHLKAYVDKTPDARAYYLIGYASYKLKDYDAAKKYFGDAYLIDRDFKASMIDTR